MHAIQSGEMEARIKAEIHMAKARSLGYSGDFVFGSDDHSILRVCSFPTNIISGIPEAAVSFYGTKVDAGKEAWIGEIISCSCLYFQRTKGCYKHICFYG